MVTLQWGENSKFCQQSFLNCCFANRWLYPMFNHKLLVPCTMNGLEYSKYKWHDALPSVLAHWCVRLHLDNKKFKCFISHTLSCQYKARQWLGFRLICINTDFLCKRCIFRTDRAHCRVWATHNVWVRWECGFWYDCVCNYTWWSGLKYK